MDKETKELTISSTEHWRRLATGTAHQDEDTSADSCALCSKFLHLAHPYPDYCNGCPVKEKTGLPKTPI